MTDRRWGRRGFLKASAASALATSLAPTLLSGCGSGQFLHGVASGDPLPDGVVIWTRVTPVENETLDVLWELAADAAFTVPVTAGVVATDASSDFSVKVDVTGLSADTVYFYRFRTADQLSEVGQTRTLPSGHVARAQFAVVSCAHFGQGHFHVYRDLAQRDDIELVVHLGDYIYESGGSAQAVRDVLPDHELRSLADYRARYAQYRGDPDLQALHARHPFVLVWDDHEIANNAYRDGAGAHGAGEGDYAERRAAAMQAYYEWLPVREPAHGARERLFRSFDFGDLLRLHMLDTRHFQRERQLRHEDYVHESGELDGARFLEDLNGPRTLLGEEQRAWLAEGLSTSTATWQVLGQQVLMFPLGLPAPVVLGQVGFEGYAAALTALTAAPATLTPEQRALLSAPNIPFNLDGWDGYPAERRWLVETARSLDVNLVVLSGDSHNAWASDIVDAEGNPVGVEVACSSVSSRGIEERIGGLDADLVSVLATALVEPLRYAETAHRGYTILSVTHAEMAAEWTFVHSVKGSTYTVLSGRTRTLRVRPGRVGRRLLA